MAGDGRWAALKRPSALSTCPEGVPGRQQPPPITHGTGPPLVFTSSSWPAQRSQRKPAYLAHPGYTLVPTTMYLSYLRSGVTRCCLRHVACERALAQVPASVLVARGARQPFKPDEEACDRSRQKKTPEAVWRVIARVLRCRQASDLTSAGTRRVFPQQRQNGNMAGWARICCVGIVSLLTLPAEPGLVRLVPGEGGLAS